MLTKQISKPRLPLRELRKRLAAIKSLDLQRVDIEFLKKQLTPILHHYVHPAPLLEPGERIFRAVPWRERPSLMAHLTYPQAKWVTTYGRVNRPGKPVFYGSVGSIAAIQELSPTNGMRMALSMWRITKVVPVVSIGYSKKVFDKLGSDLWSQIWWQKAHDMAPLGVQTVENKLIDYFLAREFTRRVPKGRAWQYKLSVAVAELFMTGKPASAERLSGLEAAGLIRPGERIAGMDVGGLIYPSIATRAHDDNVALKCESADSCLELAWVQYIEISKTTAKEDDFAPKGLDFADSVSPSVEINWLGSFPNTRAAGTDYQLAMEGGSLVLKDSLDRIAGKLA